MTRLKRNDRPHLTGRFAARLLGGAALGLVVGIAADVRAQGADPSLVGMSTNAVTVDLSVIGDGGFGPAAPGVSGRLAMPGSKKPKSQLLVPPVSRTAGMPADMTDEAPVVIESASGAPRMPDPIRIPESMLHSRLEAPATMPRSSLAMEPTPRMPKAEKKAPAKAPAKAKARPAPAPKVAAAPPPPPPPVEKPEKEPASAMAPKPAEAPAPPAQPVAKVEVADATPPAEKIAKTPEKAPEEKPALKAPEKAPETAVAPPPPPPVKAEAPAPTPKAEAPAPAAKAEPKKAEPEPQKEPEKEPEKEPVKLTEAPAPEAPKEAPKETPKATATLPPPAPEMPKEMAKEAPKAEPKPEPTQQAALTPPSKPLPGGVLAPGRALDVIFQANASKLPDTARPDLKALAERMAKQEDLRLQLLAYAGGADLNASAARRLSLSRALEVRSFLIESGLRSTRIDVRALGNKTTDIEPNRVEINIVER